MRVFLWLPGSRAGQGRTGEGRARLGKAVKARPLTTGSPFDGVSSCSPLAHCFYPRPPPAPWAPVLGSPQAALPGEGRGGGGTRPGQGPGPLVTERTPSQDLLAEEPLGIGVGVPRNAAPAWEFQLFGCLPLPEAVPQLWHRQGRVMFTQCGLSRLCRRQPDPSREAAKQGLLAP